MPQVLVVSGRQRRTSGGIRGKKGLTVSRYVRQFGDSQKRWVRSLSQPYSVQSPADGLQGVVMRLSCTRQPGERGADPHDEAQDACMYVITAGLAISPPLFPQVPRAECTEAVE